MAQSGDFENFDGTGGESIYGGSFIDENFHIRHEKPYLLTMYHKEKNQNTSQFMVTFKRAPQLDGRNTVFGEMIDGLHVLTEIEVLGRGAGKTRKTVTIVDCGLIE